MEATLGSSHTGEEETSPKVFQITASRKRKLSCGACAYSTPYLKPSKARERIRSHKEKCDILKVSNENIELSIILARVKQDFARGSKAKIPHKIYEHLKWINKAPAAHSRILLDASLDTEGYQASGAEFPSATRRRSTDLRAQAQVREGL